MHRPTLPGARLAATALALLLCPAAVSAALLVPTRAGDGADGACDERDCTLREAILAANASPGQDVILLGARVYVLTLEGTDDSGEEGDLDVTDDVILVGEGAADTAIDAGGIDRVLDVAAGASLEARDLTLRNGRASGAGGAVENGGELTLLRVVLAGNRSVGGRGGAIFSHAPGVALAVRDSTLHDNEAQGDGGAIASGEIVTLANVTLAGNRATGRGGAVYVFANSTTSIRNATVADNAAAEGGGLFVESSAFTGLPPRVNNSIVARNTAPSGTDCAGAIASAHSLIGDTSGCVRPADSADLTGVDPRLGALQGAGGPTPTLPLLAGSPAIDAAAPAPPGEGAGACEAEDQRGAARPAGSRCDVGAVETTAACVPGGAFLCLGGGRFAVRAAFQAAGGLAGAAHARGLTADTGTFWFFDRDNVELTVKVLDGCAVNGRRWVFSSGLTNVRVDLTVTDTATGATKTYSSPLGRVYRTRLDTGAFASCI